MKSQPTAKVPLVVWIVLLAAIAVAVASFAGYMMLSVRIAFADDQTWIFDEMCEKARGSDALEALGCLEYTVHYYPSGTKQVRGSRLDIIVERSRHDAVREIIEILRQKTEWDFGENPQNWIEKFPANAEKEPKADS